MDWGEEKGGETDKLLVKIQRPKRYTSRDASCP